MNPDQIQSLIRYGLTVIGALATSKGWLGASDVSALTAGILAFAGPALSLGSLIWGLVAHSEVNKVASAAAIPGVRKIIADHQLAALTASIKVVAPSVGN